SLLPRSLRHVEAEVADLAVADQVVLAFEPELSSFSHARHGAFGGDQLVVADDFRADEAARDIAMDGPRCVVRARTPRHGPAALRPPGGERPSEGGALATSRQRRACPQAGGARDRPGPPPARPPPAERPRPR